MESPSIFTFVKVRIILFALRNLELAARKEVMTIFVQRGGVGLYSLHVPSAKGNHDVVVWT